MNRLLNALAILFLATFTSIVKPFIIQARTVLIPFNGKNFYVHLLGDQHEFCTYTIKQRNNFLNFVSEKNGIVIVEDFGSSRITKKVSDTTSKYSLTLNRFLIGLAYLCKSKNLPAFNAEFRDRSDYQKLVKTREDIIKEIEKYDDQFNEFYTNTLTRQTNFENAKEHLINGKNIPLTEIRSYLQNHYSLSDKNTYLNKVKILEQKKLSESSPALKKLTDAILVEIQFELLDCRILNQLHLQMKTNNHTHIFICAGRIHTHNIYKVLKKYANAKDIYESETKVYKKVEVGSNSDKHESYIVDLKKYFNQMSQNENHLPQNQSPVSHQQLSPQPQASDNTAPMPANQQNKPTVDIPGLWEQINGLEKIVRKTNYKLADKISTAAFVEIEDEQIYLVKLLSLLQTVLKENKNTHIEFFGEKTTLPIIVEPVISLIEAELKKI